MPEARDPDRGEGRYRLDATFAKSSCANGIARSSPSASGIGGLRLAIDEANSVVCPETARRSDQPFLSECVAEVAMIAALHNGLGALELDIPFADFVGDGVVTGTE